MKKAYITTGILFLAMSIVSCGNSDKTINNHADHKDPVAAEAAHDHPATDEDSVKYRSSTLTIAGEVNFPLTLTVDSLKQMNVVGFDSANIVCQSGAVTSSTISSRGVLLKDILKKAQVKQRNHKDRNFYIVARASDGYKATFSWSEIFNNPTGDNTYVIFEENGLSIVNRGAMILNTNNDIKTGIRHVIWLKSIEVNRVE